MLSFKDSIGLAWIRLAAICIVAVCSRGESGTPLSGSDQPPVKDVRAAFAAISSQPTRLGAWTNNVMPWPAYRLSPAHYPQSNHFQGLQRLSKGPYLVISGSDLGYMPRSGATREDPSGWDRIAEPSGDLLIVKLAGSGDGSLAAATVSPRGFPGPYNQVVSRVRIVLPPADGTPLWHPGGLALVGDILLVPVENYLARMGPDRSVLLFYSLADPERPERLPVSIDRATGAFQDKAGAAAFNRLPDGRCLVLARTTRELSFYVSHGVDLLAGFPPRPLIVWNEMLAEAARGLERRRFGGAGFQIVRQADGRLFIISFSSRDRPEAMEQHIASLWTLEFPDGIASGNPRITLVAERIFEGSNLHGEGWGSFSTAAGIHVTQDGRLAIYAAPRWLVTAVGERTYADMSAGRAAPVEEEDRVFLPMLEFWSRIPEPGAAN